MSAGKGEDDGRRYTQRRGGRKLTTWVRGRAGAVDFTPSEVNPEGSPRVAEPKAKRGTGGDNLQTLDGPARRRSVEEDWPPADADLLS